MRRNAIVVGSLVAAGLLASCGSNPSATKKPSSTTQAQAQQQTTTTPVPETTAPAPATTTTTTNPPAPTLTGYGATLAAWKGSHVKDANYVGFPAYGPTVSTPMGPQPQYIEVQDDGTRITQFIESLPEDTPLSTAQTDVLEAMPSDTVAGALDIANQGQSSPGESCAFWNLQSPTLAAVGAGGANGEVVVEMAYDDENGEPTYRPNDINTVTFEVGANDSSGTC
jgi:hypothetical protein